MPPRARACARSDASPHIPSDCPLRIFPLHACFLARSRAVPLDMLSQLLDLGCNAQARGNTPYLVLIYHS